MITEIAPCTTIWDNPSGGSWFEPTNWAPAHVPGPGDVACVSGGGGLGPTIATGEGVTVGAVRTEHYGSLNNQGDLRLVGTTLESQLEAIGSGTIYVGEGANLILGSGLAARPTAFAAQISGPGHTTIPAGVRIIASGLTLSGNFTNRGTVEVSGCPGLVLGADLVNEGTITGQGCVVAAEGASGVTLQNAAGATISPTGPLTGDVRVTGAGDVVVPGGSSFAFAAEGAPPYTEFAGVGGRWLGGGTIFVGTPQAPDRILGLGVLSVESNGSVSLNPEAAADLAGVGQLRMSGGTVSTGVETVLPGQVDGGYGTFEGAGAFVVPAGGHAVASGLTVRAPLTNRGTVEVSGCPGLVLGADLVNEGTITGQGCVVAAEGASGVTLQNAAGATISPTGPLTG